MVHWLKLYFKRYFHTSTVRPLVIDLYIQYRKFAFLYFGAQTFWAKWVYALISTIKKPYISVEGEFAIMLRWISNSFINKSF